MLLNLVKQHWLNSTQTSYKHRYQLFEYQLSYRMIQLKICFGYLGQQLIYVTYVSYPYIFLILLLRSDYIIFQISFTVIWNPTISGILIPYSTRLISNIFLIRYTFDSRCTFSLDKRAWLMIVQTWIFHELNRFSKNITIYSPCAICLINQYLSIINYYNFRISSFYFVLCWLTCFNC